MEIEEIISNEKFTFKDLLKEPPQDMGNAVVHKYPEGAIAMAEVNNRIMSGKALLNPRRLAFEHIKLECPLEGIQSNKQYILEGDYQEGEFIVNSLKLKN